MDKPRILCVDDDRSTITIISGVLRKEGFEVETALDGTEGLQKARALKPDLIVLDIAMPKMDGYEVHRRLRGDPKTAHIGLLLLTAKAGVDKIIDADRPGADRQAIGIGAIEFMTKPVKARELVERIRAMMRQDSSPLRGSERHA